MALNDILALVTGQTVGIIGGTAATSWVIKDISPQGTVANILEADRVALIQTFVPTPATAPKIGTVVRFTLDQSARYPSKAWVVIAYFTTPSTGAIKCVQLQDAEDVSLEIWGFWDQPGSGINVVPFK